MPHGSVCAVHWASGVTNRSEITAQEMQSFVPANSWTAGPASLVSPIVFVECSSRSNSGVFELRVPRLSLRTSVVFGRFPDNASDIQTVIEGTDELLRVIHVNDGSIRV